MNDTSRETTPERITYSQYLVQLRRKNDKNENKNVKALINLDSKVNTIQPAYTTTLAFCTRKIDVNIQKIDKFYLDIFGKVIVDCSVKNKLRRIQFF